MTSSSPPMLYDYGGFPAHTYEVQWPAPGSPELARQVVDLLEGAGLSALEDSQRGFDHGAFVPLSLMFPDAGIPTVQLSLRKGLDPATHLRIGEALAPLRDCGVLLIGSGMSYHNLRALFGYMNGGPAPTGDSQAFDGWLAETVSLPAEARARRLILWSEAPAARAAHPREEHLLPLHVIAGAAGTDSATLPFRGRVLGAHVSAVHFG
jgi:aromatic ring-opening dioxygenase catalytic subunit (LigB family)